MGIYDWGAGDLGTLTNWELKIDYIVGVPATPAVWTPAMDYSLMQQPLLRM